VHREVEKMCRNRDLTLAIRRGGRAAPRHMHMPRRTPLQAGAAFGAGSRRIPGQAAATAGEKREEP
jgi:hypothetical protein